MTNVARAGGGRGLLFEPGLRRVREAMVLRVLAAFTPPHEPRQAAAALARLFEAVAVRVAAALIDEHQQEDDGPARGHDAAQNHGGHPDRKVGPAARAQAEGVHPKLQNIGKGDDVEDHADKAVVHLVAKASELGQEEGGAEGEHGNGRDGEGHRGKGGGVLLVVRQQEEDEKAPIGMSRVMMEATVMCK